ncbi:MAG TPA: hypothetical protein ENF26_01220 [Methanomicrobia archaeon]|nr:hypothetical protein [Methanomicrobia archaeon]HEX58752.1 hypothetical protein [Methanomicrobia archaeon]
MPLAGRDAPAARRQSRCGGGDDPPDERIVRTNARSVLNDDSGGSRPASNFYFSLQAAPEGVPCRNEFR